MDIYFQSFMPLSSVFCVQSCSYRESAFLYDNVFIISYFGVMAIWKVQLLGNAGRETYGEYMLLLMRKTLYYYKVINISN